jgi:sugar lactone lactonase YvrE
MTRLRMSLVLAALLGGCGSSADDCGGPGVICTWAGTGERGFNGDGRAPRDSSFYWPLDLEFAPDGTPYLLDWNNHRVRRIGADGKLKTVIGSYLPGDGPPDQGDMRPEGAPGTSCELNHPTDIQFLPDGKLVLAAWHNHKIRTYDPATGLVRVICGAGPGNSPDHVVAARAVVKQPKAVAVDGAGRIYLTDSGNQRIRVIDTDGVLNQVAGTGSPGFGGDGGAPLSAAFNMQSDPIGMDNPEPGGGIALDAEGRLYLGDTFNHRVRRIDFAAGTVTTVAGSGTKGFSGDGGPATEARLDLPRDVEIGPDGRLYIADTDNHRIRAVDLATGVITTVAGNGSAGFSGDGGPAASAQLARPFGIAFDAQGNLYVADTFNDRIRVVYR